MYQILYETLHLCILFTKKITIVRFFVYICSRITNEVHGKMKPMKKILSLLLMVCPIIATAQNPIIHTQYTADPTARVFNNKVYLYPSHDIIPPEGQRKDYFYFPSAPSASCPTPFPGNSAKTTSTVCTRQATAHPRWPNMTSAPTTQNGTLKNNRQAK